MVAPRGVCVVAPGGCAWLLPGGHAWLLWGACIVSWGGMHGFLGGVHGEGEHAWQWGVCMAMGDMLGVHAPLRDVAGQCAGGAHPTGMHSCLIGKSNHYKGERPVFLKLYILDNYWPKRSFGQGNIFTPVCHSVLFGGGGSGPGGVPPNFRGVGGGGPPNFQGGFLQIFGGSPIFGIR